MPHIDLRDRLFVERGDSCQTKRLVDVNSLPPDAEIAPEWDAFLAALGRPAAQSRLQKLFAQGFHEAGDVETRLGFHLGQLGDD